MKPQLRKVLVERLIIEGIETGYRAALRKANGRLPDSLEAVTAKHMNNHLTQAAVRVAAGLDRTG